jgi:hypothetical protein
MRGLSLAIRFRADCFCREKYSANEGEADARKGIEGIRPGHLLNWTQYCVLVTSAAGRMAK